MRRGRSPIYKPRSMVERLADLIEELEPQHIFELGIFGGGGTLFLAELARPRRLVAIDRLPLKQIRDQVDTRAAEAGLEGVVRTFGEVDQADRGRLAEIAEEAFEGGALDLVVDDCSHLYEPTRASFNELFPRLRPGGVYVIEDWEWAHSPVGSTEEGTVPRPGPVDPPSLRDCARRRRDAGPDRGDLDRTGGRLDHPGRGHRRSRHVRHLGLLESEGSSAPGPGLKATSLHTLRHFMLDSLGIAGRRRAAAFRRSWPSGAPGYALLALVLVGVAPALIAIVSWWPVVTTLDDGYERFAVRTPSTTFCTRPGIL